jgi:integrase
MGKRERKFFETRNEAETYAKIKEIEILNQGREGATFSTQLRVMAQRAEDVLKPFNKTVLDAAEFYAKHLRTISGSRRIADVVAELLAAREADGMSAAYLHDLRIRLGSFVKTFGDRMIAELTAKDVSVWLRALKVGAVSRNTVRRRLSTLFVFAKRQGYTAENPIADVDRAKELEGEIEILTVAQTARLLESAHAETLPYWTIGAFAGLRSAEIGRLDWSEVDFEAGLIEVKAAKSKTASRRLVNMQPNLREWLAPYRKHRVNVCPIGLRKKLEADRDRADLREDWPSNALRHSFGSYHLAQFKDAAALALQMGNSPAMIFKHYRELVKPKDAERYWQIKPGALAEKVVSFTN